MGWKMETFLAAFRWASKKKSRAQNIADLTFFWKQFPHVLKIHELLLFTE